MVLKCNQQVACLWNGSPTIFKLRAATFVNLRIVSYNLTSLLVASYELIIRLWVGSRISLHYIKSALSVHIISSLHVKLIKSNQVIWYIPILWFKWKCIGKICKCLCKYRLITEAAAHRQRNHCSQILENSQESNHDGVLF